MKMYEITAQHKDLLKLADTSDEDMAQAIDDTFEALTGDFEEKAISVIHVAMNFKADEVAIDMEIKRLQARKKQMTNKQESLKEYLRINMLDCGITKIDCPLFSITLGKPRKICLINDEDKIPAEWLNIKTVMSPMKVDILKALKAGEDIPGAELGESKSSLIIK